jgi:ferrous iron transport protein B
VSGRAPLPQVLIAGNPNCGKSTLFNALSGGSAHVGNYPGVTVDRSSARLRRGTQDIELVDVPGMYSLTASSPEEQLAVNALTEGDTKAVVCVVDATTLQRGLYLALQLIESGVSVVVALNMMDAAERLGLRIDTERLSELFGAPFIPVVATKRRGLDALLVALDEALEPARGSQGATVTYPVELEADLAKLIPVVAQWRSETPRSQLRVFALWCLLSLGDDSLRGVPDDVRRAVHDIREDADARGRDVDLEIISSRYAWLDDALSQACSAEEPGPSWSERIDRVLTHPIVGLVVFAVVMFGIFEALFAGAEPLIGAIESLTGFMQAQAAAILPPGVLQDLVVEGIIAGVGNVIVFAPQILMLFLFIGFLEDSGYLARVAFVIDRVMKGVGLHGKAFVPLLSGFACAVPAVMATRTIERRRDRLVTMLALPLMSCSARLPVYILVVGTVFAGQSLGWFSAGAVDVCARDAAVPLAFGANPVAQRLAPVADLSRRCGDDHLGNDHPPLGATFFSEIRGRGRALRRRTRARGADGGVGGGKGRGPPISRLARSSRAARQQLRWKVRSCHRAGDPAHRLRLADRGWDHRCVCGA